MDKELREAVSVRHLGGHRLEVVFDDGAKGEVDLSEYVSFQGVFECLQEENEVAKAFIDTEGGVVAWPHGADLDSDALYARIILDQDAPSWAMEDGASLVQPGA